MEQSRPIVAPSSGRDRPRVDGFWRRSILAAGRTTSRSARLSSSSRIWASSKISRAEIVFPPRSGAAAPQMFLATSGAGMGRDDDFSVARLYATLSGSALPKLEQCFQ